MLEEDRIAEAAAHVRNTLGLDHPAEVGIILGTGLGGWASQLTEAQSVPYAEIPHLPQATVSSHQGALWHGRCNGLPVLVLQGRCHLYEGYTPQEVCRLVRLLGALGVTTLVTTNAAGSLNPLFPAGQLMRLTDQINMTGSNPLTGPNLETFGPRFPDMSEVFDPELGRLADTVALEQGLRLERGVYVGIQGPSLETPAETRMYRCLGGDAIGMSTVMETIAAAHMSMRQLGVSCLTNQNLPDCQAPTSLEEIIAQAEASSRQLTLLLEAVCGALATHQ